MHPYATDSSERKSIPSLIAVLSVIAALVLDRLITHTFFTVPWWFDSPAIIGFYSIFYYLFSKSLWKHKIFYYLFSKSLWKHKIIQKIGIVKLPNLNGTWKGYVTSSFDEHSKKYDTTFTIRQNWNRISIVGEFEMSRSHSSTASIIVDDKNGITVNYDYMNEPFSYATQTMEIHRGFNTLTLKPNGKEMSGTYYSGRGRQNTGQLVLEKV